MPQGPETRKTTECSVRSKGTTMPDGDVETIDKGGQWVNRVIGESELSESFSSRDEAVAAGHTLAQELGTVQSVRESAPTGAITDRDEN